MPDLTYELDRYWSVPTPSPLVHGLFWGALIGLGIALLLLQRRFRPRPLVAILIAIVLFINLELALQMLAASRPDLAYGAMPSPLWRLPPSTAGVMKAVDVPLIPHMSANWNGVMPNGTEVSSNALGMRERDIPFDKPRGEFRIVMLGDSWTFGQGVAQEETFSRRLEARLQKKYPDIPIRVINCGMPGSTWMQGYLLLTTVGLRYHPDLVITCGFNSVDALPALGEVDPQTSPARAVLRRLLTYAVLRSEILALSPAPPEVMTGRDYQERIATLLASMDIRAICFDHARFGRRSEGMAHEYDVPGPTDELWVQTPRCTSIGIWPRAFTANAAPFMQEGDPFHPSAFGHDQIARILTEYLVDHHIIEDILATPH